MGKHSRKGRPYKQTSKKLSDRQPPDTLQASLWLLWGNAVLLACQTLKFIAETLLKK